MFIYDKIIYKWFKVSIAVNFVLVILTTQCCQSHSLKMLHRVTSRISGYLTLLAICVEFTEELGDMECAK